MFSDRISGRIFLTLAGMLVILLGGAALFGEVRVRAVVGAGEERRLQTTSNALIDHAREALAAGVVAPELAAEIDRLADSARVRITLITADGVVLADSDNPLPLQNHADRPEIVAARAGTEGRARRASATTGVNTTYLARRVDAGGQLVGFVRTASDMHELQAALRELHRGLITISLVALGVCALCALFLTRRMSEPLEAIERSAAQLAAGELEARIRVDGPVEVKRVAESINTLARELKLRLSSSQRARSEIETILSGMAEGVVAVDGEERVLLMNQAASQLLGLGVPLASGARLWQHMRFPELERGLRAALAGGGAWNGDALSPRQDGRTLRLSIAPVHASGESDEGPAFNGAVALLSDVTDVRRLEQVRIDFVANVSHELRTPLAAVMGALETLTDPVQDEATRARFLELANRNAVRLQAIVSDLLDLSSIEAEGDRMPLEPVRVDAPLRTAASALAGRAESKGVRVELPLTLTPAVWVNGNNERLEQVFTNLLENAIKYTPSGGSIRARVRPTPREVAVDVEDTGVGIPATSLPRVFERFYRVDRSRSREMGGTGLGLAIVKHVLRAHGGQVSVKSEEGRGSTFTVTLPRLLDAERNKHN